MPQEFNLNTAPYYDDFDRDDDFYRVLFKPGYPIQARELTTLQSILQSQIEKFGDHFFKEGRAISGGEVQYYEKYPCVIVEETYNGKGILEYAADLVGEIIVGQTSGIRAKIDSYQPATTSERGLHTFYIRYLSSDASTKSFTGFTAGEVLLTEDGFQTTNNLAEEFENDDPNAAVQEDLSNVIIFNSLDPVLQCISTNPNEIGSAVHINEGVYYIRGHFVECEEKTLLLDQYDDQPTYKIGFIVNEEIVTYVDDENLLDNAQGFSNFTAPGADRFKIDIDLVKIDLDENDDLENFIQIMEVINGEVVNRNRSAQQTEFDKRLAEIVDDIAGDFYVAAPDIDVLESLNDKEGNDGVYDQGQTTIQGQQPDDDLGVYKISPLKAYVNGFETEIPTPTYLDFKKPRTTKKLLDQQIKYNTGPTLQLNRVYGYPTIGIQTSFYVTLRDERVGTAQTIAAGKEIGVARVWDYELEDGSYDATNLDLNVFDLALYDVRPYVELELNAPVTLTTPIHIKGKATGSIAHLRFDVSNSGIATVYDVNGRFNVGEKLIFNGVEENSRVVKKSTEFGISNVRSVHGTNSNGTYFNADTKLFATNDVIGSVSISTAVGGVSTVSSATVNLDKIFDVGDYVSYTNPQNSELITYSQVTAVAKTNMRISGITTVTDINQGSLPTSEITPSDFKKIQAKFQEGLEGSDEEAKLYTELPKDYVSNVDLVESSIDIREVFDVTITNNVTAAIQAGTDRAFLPFNPSRYILTRDDGSIEELTEDKFDFSSDFTQVTIKGLGSNTTGKLLATLTKNNLKNKVKIITKVGSIVIDKSRDRGSGIGSTTINDGLTYGNYPYGTRVQDEEICLFRPDVTDVLAIYESDDTNEPDILRLELSNIGGITNTTRDVAIGERFQGAKSEAIGMVIERVNDTTISYVLINDDSFEAGENIGFQDSQITATVVKLSGADNNVTDKYELEDGYRDTIYDYAYIKRKKDVKPSKRKLKILYSYADYGVADTGDITTVNSYKNFKYKDIPETDEIRHADIIDLRPRVDAYNVVEGGRSPFEFFGRSFDGDGNSSQHILASDELIVIDYEFFLPRVDKIFLDETGVFHNVEGAAAEEPVVPASKENAIEIATISLPAFLEDVDDARIEVAEYKRYSMDDIGDLEDRIKKLEYYTSLSMLESSTAALKVTDSVTGLDRFKSGFFVDDFSTAENQLKITINKNSVDTEKRELRAAPYTTQIDLELGTFNNLGIGTDVVDSVNLDPEYDSNLIGEGVRKTGRVITLDYDEQVEIVQPYATQNVPINTIVDIFYQGELTLQPETDAWVQQNRGGCVGFNNRRGKYWFTNRQMRKMKNNPNWGWGGVTWRDWRNHWKGVPDRRGDKVKGDRPNRKGDRKRLRKRIFGQRKIKINKDGIGAVPIKNPFWAKRVKVGARFVSVTFRKWMRMRNIEFRAVKMKPFTRVYPFFDDIPVSNTSFPKLLEIQMVKGTFQVGETVIAAKRRRFRVHNTLAIKVRKRKVQMKAIRGWRHHTRFSSRVCKINHLDGPFNAPTKFYRVNPYSQTLMPTSYASNSTILNIDTFIMTLQSKGKYWGFITGAGMKLKGQTSKAICKIVNKKFVTDENGQLRGNFFLPKADGVRKNKFGRTFTAGVKTFRLVDSPTNSEREGEITTAAEDQFTCVGSDVAKRFYVRRWKIPKSRKCTLLPIAEVGDPKVLLKCTKKKPKPPRPEPDPRPRPGPRGPGVPTQPTRPRPRPRPQPPGPQPQRPQYPVVPEPDPIDPGPDGGGDPIRPRPPVVCPDPNALILMHDGSQKRAGDLVVGDMVKTYHEDTFEYGDYPVIHASIVEDVEKLKLIFSESEITCSIYHKFRVGDSWKEARDMEVGDEVSGQTLKSIETVENGPVVHITVEGAHTYISEGLLSHNKRKPPPPPPPEEPKPHEDPFPPVNLPNKGNPTGDPQPTPPSGKRPRPKIKTAKVKYVFDKKGKALPVWYVPYTIKKGKNKGKTRYLTFDQIRERGGNKDAKKAFKAEGYPLPPKKYPGRGKPARPIGGKKKTTSIAVRQKRNGEMVIIDTTKKARKLQKKGVKSNRIDIIKPEDKDYGFYNKGEPQLWKYGATLIATQHPKASKKVTKRGEKKFEKKGEGFPINKLPLKRGSIKKYHPRPTPPRRRTRPRPAPSPAPSANRRRALGSGYPPRPAPRPRPRPAPRPPRPGGRPARRGGERGGGRRGRRSDFLLKTNIMIIRNALNRLIRI